MKKDFLKVGVVAVIAWFAFSCKKEPIAPTGITLTPASFSLNVGESFRIGVIVSPSNASGSVTWNSDNKSIAIINSSGIVTGVAFGRVVITATSTIGNQIATCEIKINKWNIYSSNCISSIAIDAQGNKWISSEGVSKFDGTNWTTYNTTNSGLASNIVNAIAIDSQGNKWFGTLNKGISKFDGVNWTTYNATNSGLANDHVNVIAIDFQGNEWFGRGYANNRGGGLSKFDGVNWTTYDTTTSGISFLDVNAIAFDAEGNKWIGSDYGISKIVGTNWTDYLADSVVVTSIAIDAQGDKWFGTFNGVYKFDGIKWTNYTPANSGLASIAINAIAIDKQDNKWFGTLNEGISKFDGRNWTYYNTPNYNYNSPVSGSSNFNNVRCIAIDAQGNKWFGGCGGLFELQEQN